MTSDRGRHIILLVEDDPLLSTTLRRYLERWSDDVRLAETCAQAIDAWSAMPSGLVLMDYRLPDGFGTDVVSRMREKGRRETVLCMTGEAESISPEFQKSLGIHRVLGKPVMLDVLRPELDTLSSVSASPAPRSRRGREGRSCGKFRLIQWHGPLTGDRVDRLCTVAKGELWVALDVTRAGEAHPDAWPRLSAWSGWLSGAGGRLCLIAREPSQRLRVEREVGGYMDVLDSTATLEAQSVRLIGAAERRQLRDLITTFGRRETPDA